MPPHCSGRRKSKSIYVRQFFTPISNTKPFFKAAIQGFAGSGKTHTAATVAIGLSTMVRKGQEAHARAIARKDAASGSPSILTRMRRRIQAAALATPRREATARGGSCACGSPTSPMMLDISDIIREGVPEFETLHAELFPRSWRLEKEVEIVRKRARAKRELEGLELYQGAPFDI